MDLTYREAMNVPIFHLDLTKQEAWKLGWDSNVQDELHKGITATEKVRMCLEIKKLQDESGKKSWREICKDMLQEHHVRILSIAFYYHY